MLDGHHVFRRGTIAGIPAWVCETPELIIALCCDDPATGREGCHDRFHRGDVQLMDEVRWMAVERFAARRGLALLARDDYPAGPIEAMRIAVRQVEEREEAART